jgi:hypothetical protein
MHTRREPYVGTLCSATTLQVAVMTAVDSGENRALSDSQSTDLSTYEKIKFELADIARFAAAKDTRHGGERYAVFLDFFARLAEDRFNIVVVGRFNRGKTSLMNAILATDRLPTGLVPLTSVITSVSYGSSERVHLEFERGGWRPSTRRLFNVSDRRPRRQIA